MSLVDVLKLLKQHKIQISLENDQLKVNAAKGAMTKELMQLLKDNKPALLQWAQEQHALSQSSQSSIQVQARDQRFPLSFNQQRLWLLHKISPETASYNMPMALQLSGQLDVKKLEQALQQLLSRHEVFHLRLDEDEQGTAYQTLAANKEIKLNTESIQENLVESTIQQLALQPFQLKQSPLFRIHLFCVDSEKHILLFNIHHIIGDRVSIEKLFQELGQIYLTGSAATLTKNPIDYLDYAAWQNNEDNAQLLEKQLSYWREHLAQTPSALNCPTDNIRSAHNISAPALQHHLTLDKDLAKQCRAKAKELGLTPFMFYFAAQQLLFSKLAQQDNFCTGVPIAGRHIPGTENLVGYFVNTLALRCNISHNPSLHDFLASIKNDVLNAFDHQDLPLDQIIAELQIPSVSSHSTLIQYGFNYINQQVDTDNLDHIKLDTLSISPLALGENESKYEQIWSITDKQQFSADTVEIAIEYNSALFNEKSIAWFSQCFVSLLNQFIICEADQAVKSISLFPQSQLAQWAIDNWSKDNSSTIETLLPLIPMQRDLHIDSAMSEGAERNYFGQCISTPQHLEHEILQQALNLITQRFSSLRQRIIHAEQLFNPAYGLDHAYAAILSASDTRSLITIENLQWPDLSSADFNQAIDELCYQTIDCATAPLFRFYHIEKSQGVSHIIICAHHSAIDVVGMNNISKQLSLAYQGIEQGLTSENILSTLAEDCFPDYIQHKIQHCDQAASINYWRRKSTLVEPLASNNHLAQIEQRPNKFHDLREVINEEHYQAISSYCQQYEIDLAHYLKACYALCLASNNHHQQGLFFDEAIASRSREQKQGIACYFEQRPVIIEEKFFTKHSNNISASSFIDLCQAIKHAANDAKHNYPISNKLHAEYFPAGQASYQFNQYIAETDASFNNCTANYRVIPPRMDNAVNFMVISHEKHLELNLCYFENHFSGNHFLSQFIALSESVLDESASQLGQGLASPQQDEITLENSQRVTSYLADKPFIPLIQSIYLQANKTPDAIAVIHSEQQLSYRQLIEKTEQLSRIIQQQILSDRIAICLPSSADFIIAVLASLRCGKAYIPIDSKYPQERIEYIIQDAKASLLICYSETKLSENSNQQQRINLDSINFDGEIANVTSADFTNIEEQNAFYTIYTSGSTGKPKGASVSQRNAQLLAHWYQAEYDIQSCDRNFIISAVGFDLTQKNIFSALITGASIVFPETAEYDERAFLSDIQKNTVSLINCAPSAFYPIAELAIETNNTQALSSLRFVLFGGEAISLKRLLPWLSQADCLTQIVNMYGPTECTDISSSYLLDNLNNLNNSNNIPIGISPNYVQSFIVDPWLNPVAKGCAGELIIAGPAVGLGYLDRDELNQELFIESSTLKSQGLSQVLSNKIYRTGDLVVKNEQGQLYFISRLDHQVKIRGLRIELGEIEQVINQLEQYKSSLCLVSNDTIVAYALKNKSAATNSENSNNNWRQILSESLPDYMLPAQIIELDFWPLTANGKIDRNALPKPESISQSIIPARNETEQQLIDIWQSVLGIEPIGVYNNFFDLGGHSLLAARIATGIKQQFNKDVALRHVFEDPTIAHLAKLIDSESIAIGQPQPFALQHLPETEAASLSTAQERLWFIDQLTPGSNQYNIPFALKLTGKVNIQALQKSFTAVLNRQQVLATRIETEHAQAKLSFDQQPILSHHQFTEDESALKRYAADFLLSPFDLSEDCLVKMELIEFSSSFSKANQATAATTPQYLLLLAFHHIIADGWSIDIFIRDLLENYQHFAFNAALSLPELEYQYSDYAWSEKQLTATDESLAYWQRRLQGSQLVDLPFDFERPQQLAETGAQLSFTVEPSLAENIKQFAKQENTSLFNVIHSAFNLLLSQYSGQSDIVIGTPVANRQHAETQNLIGFFANTLVLRHQINQDDNFTQLLSQVSKNNLADFERQHIAFESLIDVLDIPRELNQTPLFNVMLVLQANSQSANDNFQLPGIQIEAVNDVEAINSAKFDLTLNIADSQDGLKANIEYRTALFNQESIQALYNNFIQLLNNVIKNSQTPLKHIDLFDFELASTANNDSQVDWPKMNDYDFTPFIQRFEKHAELGSSKTALSFKDNHNVLQQWSFEQLNQKANQLAHSLINLSITPQSVVAICLPRGGQMMQALLAIQKAGAVYVPIDLSLPADRATYMIENCQAERILINNESLENPALTDCFENLKEKLLNIDEQIFTDETSHNPNIEISSSDLAYILYTSGSTGKPKGTLIEQLGFDHYLQFAANYYYQDAQQSVVSSSLSFDATITSLFSALCQGLACHITAQSDDKFIELAELIFNNETPSLFKITPAHIELFTAQYKNNQISNVSHIFIIGGDQLKTHQLLAFQKLLPSSSFVNEYGPTETVVGCSVEFVNPDTDIKSKHTNVINIGKAISHTTLYLLDAQKREVPKGVAGELYIAGYGVGRGYLNRDEESAKAFLNTDQIISQRPIESSRLYRSGDMVKQKFDNKLVYLGRADDQVKIRGLRIELGEIEHQLSLIDGIIEPTVLAKLQENDEPILVAYSVNNSDLDEVEIKQALALTLPTHMIPAAFIAIEGMPLTPNGKVDKKALLSINIQAPVKDFIAAETPSETSLSELWQALLNKNAISVTESFFELGGHSLLAIRLASDIERKFNISFNVRQVFEYASIRAMATYIEQAAPIDSSQQLPVISPIERSQENRLALSFNQQRLWFVYQLDKAAGSYNMPTALRIKGEINLKALEQAGRFLIARHELLRTIIQEDSKGSYQSILPTEAINFSLNTESIDFNALEKNEIETLLLNSSRQAFALESEPCFRINLWLSETTENEHDALLLINLHHIIGDAISLEVLVTELVHCYLAFSQQQQPQLLNTKIQYADYAQWQQRYVQGDFLEQQLDWWQQQLSGAAPLLNLPTDKPRPNRQTHEGQTITASFPSHLVSLIRNHALNTGLTPFMILLAAQQLLLGRLANQDDICVGVPLAGRHIDGTENLLGFFINALAIRTDLSENPNCEDYLNAVKHTVLSAFSHQDAPFEKVIERLKIDSNASYSPLVQVGFNYIHQQQSNQARIQSIAGELSVEGVELGGLDAKYDQIWAFLDDKNNISLTLEFKTALFSQATIQHWISSYFALLETLISQPTTAIKKLNYIDNQQLIDSLDWKNLKYQAEDIECITALTPMQRDMYIDQLLTPDNRRNYLGWIQHADQIIDSKLFQQALDIIKDHHSALRMRIVDSNHPLSDMAYQVILKGSSSQIILQELDWSEAGLNGTPLSKAEFDIRCNTLGFTPYDMGNDSLVRLFLIKDTANTHTIVLSAHHTCIDGMSMQAITSAYTEIYSLLKAGKTVDGSHYFGDDLYPNYVEQQYLHCDNQSSLNFWHQTMLDVEPPKPFNSGFHSSTPTYYTREVKDSARHMANIQAYCAEHNIAEITYLKSIYALMIQSHCFATDDFYFSEILAARPKGHSREIGCYFEQRPTVVNAETLNNANFLEFLQSMEDYRLSVRSGGRISNGLQHQLFQQGSVSFLFNFYPMPRTLPFDEGHLRMNFITPEMTDAVTFTCIIDGDSLLFTFSYTDNVFEDNHFTERFIALSEQILAGENNIEKLNISAFDNNNANDLELNTQPQLPATSYKYLSVIDAIEQQVTNTPLAIASVSGEQKLNYQSLNQQANALAEILQKNFQLGNNDSAAICLPAGNHFLISLLAVLKTGAYYIPVDSNYPSGRISYMLDNANAKCLISNQHTIQAIDSNHSGEGNSLAELDQLCLLDNHSFDSTDTELNSTANSKNKFNRSENIDAPLYAIYTSGSTGLPKGALVSQRGELNLITWYNETFNFNAHDSTLIISSLGFDLTQKNLLAPLCTGAKIVFSEEEYDPELIIQLIQQHQISFINCAPSAFYPLLDADNSNQYQQLSSLTTVLFGGEPIRTAELSQWHNTQLQNNQAMPNIVNMYGPTECTDIASFHIINDINHYQDKVIPIGRANANVQLHILDASGKILPKNYTGELCISGESLGLGYINNTELSRQVFKQHPLLGPIYHTGDLVKLLDNGDFEFVSRIDHQVKIRGLRIELGEIETQLKQLTNVRDALVQAIDDSLYAYILCEHTPENWRSELAHYLPAYMVPQHVFHLNAWPLTPNGKIDRKALPTSSNTQRTIIQPSNETEATLLTIFQRHLARNDISIDDNFFDIGGHSLLAARAVADIRDTFNQELPLREVFFSPSIESIAQLLSSGSLNATTQHSNLPTLEILSTEQQQAIHPDIKQGQYPLSLQQQRLWLIEQIQGSSSMYSMPIALVLTGTIDIAALRLAIQALGQQHNILKARMSQKDNNAYQYIHNEDLTLHLHRFDNENSRQRSIAWDIQKPFQPSHDEALFIAHAYVLNHQSNHLILLLNLHHIISDGLSNSIILKQLAQNYIAATQGNLETSKEDRLDYLDYALWQSQLIKAGVLEQQLSYWQQQLQRPPVLQLPIDFIQNTNKANTDGVLYSFEINTELQHNIKQLALNHKVGEYTVYLSAFAFLLARYSLQDDIIIGTAVANRPLNSMSEIVGFFVNTLALRLDADSQQNLETFINQTQNTLDKALENQALPFEKLLDALDLDRDLSHSPVFQAFFNYQSITEQTANTFEFDSLKIDAFEPPQSDQELHRQAKFEFSLNITQSSNSCTASIEYRSQLFLPSTIQRFAEHFNAVLKCFIEQSDCNKPLAEISFLSNAELLQQLSSAADNSFNNTQVDFSNTVVNFEKNRAIHQYFEDQVLLSLNAIAVKDEHHELSYSKLNQEANRLACHLQTLGVKPGDSIAICMTRSVTLSVALLASLKCGAHYVPFDPSFPVERLQFMAQDTQANVVLFNTDGLSEFNCADIAKQLNIEHCIAADKASEFKKYSIENLNIAIEQQAIFNIIYTSGSTGKPKGVIVPHSGIINRLLWMQSEYPITADDKVLQKTPYSFDVSVWELFWPLITGSQLVYAKPEGHKDPDYLYQCIQQHGISTLHFVPSMLSVFLQSTKFNSNKNAQPTSLKQVFCSGEALQVQQVNQFYKNIKDCQLHNLYGPTEASIDVSYYACQENDRHASVPIGKPIANTQLLVLDEQLNVQPIGLAGELYIGGENLALGYLNRDELNAITFIRNPYYSSHQHPSKRLYKTGDIVRFLDDGNIAYLGRSDHQVKIRGLRIELGEIENALLALNQVNEACVIAQTHQGDDYLCAYISGDFVFDHENAEEQLQISENCRIQLSRQLPQYMLPHTILVLDALPLSANGKIDRKLLPSISEQQITSETSREIIPPSSELEMQLLILWQQVLGETTISCDDNFFSIGGHSLKAASLVSTMRDKFMVEIQLRDIFDYTSISDQALLIEQRMQGNQQLPKIEASTSRVNLPLSYAQQRLWFLSQMDPNSIVYNMPAAIRLTGKINTEALKQALADIIQRHEVLRSNMQSDGGEPVLVIHASIELPITITTAANESELLALSEKDAATAFDLANDSLLRCTLIKLSDDEHALLINMHHIISDAWSIQILIKELATLYIGYAHQQHVRLADLDIQYADFSQWQRNWLQGDVLDQQIGYWRKTLAGAPELLSLPTDYPRPEIQSFKGALFKAEIDSDLLASLKQLSQKNQCTLFMTCLSAYALLLQQHSQQDDICIGIPLAGRSLAGVDSLIGFFINALVIRNDLTANLSLTELLAQTKQQVLSAFAHEHVPIEMLLNELDIDRSLAHTPIAQCAFNMISADNSLNKLFDSANLPISMDIIETEQVVAKFDMQFSLFEMDDAMNVSIEYASDLFNEETIQTFYHGYIHILEAFVAEQPFSRYQLQKHFNLGNTKFAEQTADLQSSMTHYLPLPPVIEDMYLGTMARPETLENSMGYGLFLPLAINTERWKQALTEIAQQHSMCRAFIAASDSTVHSQGKNRAAHVLLKTTDIAVFHIHHASDYNIEPIFEIIDLSSKNISETQIRSIAEKNSFIPYTPGAHNLIHYRLYKLSEQRYYFNMTCSHLISDGLSALNHAALIAEHYQALEQQSNITIQHNDLFPEFIEQSLSQFDSASTINFWHERLSGVEGLSCKTLNNDTQVLKRLALSEEHFIAIKQFCKQNIITPALYFKAIYAILIKLYSRTEADFIITEFNAGRNKDNINNLGCFFHSQPFLIQIESLEDPLAGLFKALKMEQKASRQHLKISNRQLRQMLPDSQLQFSFNFLAFDHHIELNDTRIEGDRFTPNADGLIDFRIQADGNDISLWIAYNGLLFDDKDFLERYLHISQQLLMGDIHSIKQIEYVLPQERTANKLQHSLANTATNNDKAEHDSALTHQIISNIAINSPSNIAVISANKHLSYVELEMQSNALAHILVEAGITSGDRVSILLEKRVELLPCLLACMKAGACYVPIDSNYPQERINYILDDSLSKVCLTQTKFAASINNSVKVIDIDIADLDKMTTSAPFVDVRADDAIYMIYTSGSTGKPKAASVYHHSEARLLNWYCNEYQLNHNDKTLVISATGFDLTQKNFFALLTQGGTIVFPSSPHFDVTSILEDIEKHNISMINCAPSAFYPLVELNTQRDENNNVNFSQLKSLRHVLFGGESIQLQRLNAWISDPSFACNITNMYGPTECTDISTSYTLSSNQLIHLSQSETSLAQYTFPLGTASAGVEVVLLDENLQRVPPGLAGEICISGPQVGQGYWQQSALTQASFIANPYKTSSENSRLYKTGDLAYADNIDGLWQLIYIGRKDFQVKLRGMRIELGEIENAINEVQTIKDSTVLVENDELLAFVLSDHAEASNWRDILLQQLPEYMVPKSLVFLNDWPLTPNGKVDRKALLKIPRSQLSSNQFVAPRTSLEKDLATLWTEVLGVGDLGIHDNFFESGGDSLKAVRLVARLEMRFEIKIPVASLFGAQTISQLAHVIHNETHDWSPIVPIQPQGNKTPIFAIHALGAMVLSYEPLARALGKNQPFYGIQAYGFEDEQTPYTNLHEMVSFYTQAIIEQQPEGPYQLIGHSFGGLIALEVARKLKSQNKDVSYLAMLDTHMPIRYQAIALDDAGILKVFAEHNFGVVDIPLRTLRLMKPDVMAEKVSEQFNGAVSASFIKSAIAIIRGFQKMMIAYKPAPLDIDITLIRPISQPKNFITKLKTKLFKESAITLGWHQVGKKVTVINVAGDHHSMLNKSHAEGLSMQLSKNLKENSINKDN